jgi:dipeptidyl aminopeptidase/acylaminoacyl peptidase
MSGDIAPGIRQEHDPIPEDVYGSWSPSPCPGGRRVAFVSDRSGEPRVWIAEPDPVQWTPVNTPLRRVRTVSWSPDGRWLAAVTAAVGASRTEVWLLRPDGSGLHQVGGANGATAGVGAGPWRGWSAGGLLLITETAATGEATAELVEPDRGRRTRVAGGPLLALLDVSTDGRRALLRRGPRDAYRLSVADLDDGTETRVDSGSGPGCSHSGSLSSDGLVVYACTDVGRDLAALVRVDMKTALGPEVLAERPDAELDAFALSADRHVLALTWNVWGGRSALDVLDLRDQQRRRLMGLPRDVVDEGCFLPDGSGLLLTAESWADPRGVWRLELAGAATPVSSPGGATLRSSRGATPATVTRDELTGPELRYVRSVDGTMLSGWLYRPDVPAPWPTVLHLHGGPEAQERPVYNSLFQSLVGAGVAVFAPNVRGSSGFGRAFRGADDLDGRYGAIADVAACVDHLVDSGMAEPARIGCMGRSYGGYLTLAALVWHPELFAVGVDVCGMVDLQTFYTHTEPWIAAAAASKYGDPVRDAELLHDLSPIHRIDRLRAPLLVVHGADDTNVPVEEAEQVVEALAAAGVEHRYLLFEGEGHELLATHNRVTFVEATVDWVTRHLDRQSG